MNPPLHKGELVDSRDPPDAVEPGVVKEMIRNARNAVAMKEKRGGAR